MVSQKELNIAASRAGVHRESFGEQMNLARRYARLDKPESAAQCARKALSLHSDWPHLFGQITEATLSRARQIVQG